MGKAPRVLDGLGISILSTSKGVISRKKARQLGVVVKFYARSIKSYVKNRKNPITSQMKFLLVLMIRFYSFWSKRKTFIIISSLVSIDIISDEIKVTRRGFENSKINAWNN